MDYNTNRPPLVLREYGRNVQYMIEHLQTIDDRDRRTKAAHAVVDLMGQLNPHLRTEEYREMLWDHLFAMVNYELDIDAPFDIEAPDKNAPRPTRPTYPEDDIRLKQYGKNVETMIASAIAMEDEEKQAAFVEVIGNYMKMVCAMNYYENVDDVTIRADLKRLSDGKLELDRESNLDKLAKSNSHKSSNSSVSQRRSNNRRGSSNNSRRNNNNNRKRGRNYKKS